MARALIAACAAALALGAAAGCGGGSDGRAGGPLTFQVTGDPEETAVYRRLAADYARRTGTEVRVVEVADRDAHLAKLTTSFSAGRAPDVFLLNYRELGPFAQRGVLAPAGGVAGDRRDWYGIALDAFTVDGVLQCLPQNVSSLAVFFNADAFARAGLPQPGDWTFDEFATAAARVGVGLEPGTIRALPFVWSAGEDAVRFDTPAARRGLERLGALVRAGWAPGAREASARDVVERFVRGDIGMLLGSRREVPVLRTIDDFRWDVAPFPRDVRRSSVLHSDGLCIPKGARAAAAWRFAADVLGPRGQAVLARSGRTVPSRRSVARSEAFLRSTPPAANRVFLDAVEGMRRLPNTPDWPGREDLLDDAIEQYYYGRASLEQTVARIAREAGG